jgi:16S rRNA (cytosine1402-N4)-methyltransferase
LVRGWAAKEINGILFDLGVSTYQLTSSDRGFSFNLDARLDMRMSPETQRLNARDVVNSWDERAIKKILKNYGQEPYAAKIAREIVRERAILPIEKTNELVEIIKRALPPSYRINRQKHFATSTFRALRMAVNDELQVLESGLKQALQVLSPGGPVSPSQGGRIVVISFHSLEDRIVKNFFRDNENLKILTPKPIMASEKEIQQNPKARSAKLRAAIKK